MPFFSELDTKIVPVLVDMKGKQALGILAKINANLITDLASENA